MYHIQEVYDDEAPFWLVWNPQGGAPTVKQSSYEEACKEAERLARENQKQRFHVLEAKRVCVFDPQPVHWTEVDPHWVPF